MTDTTLFIEEKERENAKALTQSFARADVKSRAYINALGAEVCLKYLRDNDIYSEPVYNLHNIRKILEEFDISDIMLSNIHIDVRVVFNTNQIFVPKSHFDFNLTPDIYVVLQMSKDYSKMRFLGFFEPKMLNKKNTNGEYYFIEKEKLSSPVDLKNYINNFTGNTSKDMSEEDIENAEYLIISMADHNVTEDDKKKLLNCLKDSAKLRNSFIEFENFEMLAYQAVNTLDIDKQNESEFPLEQMSSYELDNDTVEDIELSNALNDVPNISDDAIENNEINNNENENLIGDIAKGAAVLGAEIAGTAVASAALAGAAEASEITQEGVEALNTALDATEEVSEAVLDAIDSIDTTNENNAYIETPEQEEKEPETNIPEEITDETANKTETLENVDSYNNTNGDSFNFSELDGLDQAQNDEPEQNFEQQNKFSDLQNSLDSLFTDDPKPSQSETVDMPGFDTFDSFENSNSDDIVFSNNDDFDDLVFENNDEYDSYDSDMRPLNSSSSSGISSSGKPVISPVEHTPISEATDLVSLESIKLGQLPPLETPKDQMETLEMDEFQSLVDQYVPNPIKDESETVDFNTIPEDKTPIVQGNNEENIQESAVNETEMIATDMEDLPDEVELPSAIKEDELTSDAFVEEMPEEVVSDIKTDDLSSDDFMQDMPEEVVSNIKTDDLSSDDFMQDMPEEVVSDVKTDDLSSEDFIQDMPEEVVSDIKTDDLSSDDFIQDMPEEVVSDVKTDDLSSDDFIQDMPEEVVSDIKMDNVSSDDFMQDMPEEVNNKKEATTLSANDNLPEDINFENGLALGELNDINEEASMLNASEPTDEPQEPALNADNSPNNFDNISINEEPNSSNFDDLDEMKETQANEESATEEASQIGVLYSGTENNQIESSELQDESENYDFRPKKKGINIMPVFAIVAAVIIAGSVVGFLVKNKNSIDSETLVQSSTDDALTSPETNNTDILANEDNNGVEPAIPTEMEDIAPAPTAAAPAISKENKQEVVKNAKEAIKKQQEQVASAAPKTPVNASKTVALKKLSWEVPDYLSYSDNIRKYLQTAGKSIKLTLSSDLLLTNEYIYSNQVKVDLKLTKDGNIQDVKVIGSSGSNQVDKIVLQTVKDTLNVVKPPQGEVPTPNYNLGLIIYL